MIADTSASAYISLSLFQWWRSYPHPHSGTSKPMRHGARGEMGGNSGGKEKMGGNSRSQPWTEMAPTTSSHFGLAPVFQSVE